MTAELCALALALPKVATIVSLVSDHLSGVRRIFIFSDSQTAID
jgi:hypothetical protein